METELKPWTLLDGNLVDSESACVHVLDRGFLFGDSVYEVIPAYAGRLFAFDQHLARLRRSLEEAGIPDPLDREAWRRSLQDLLNKNGGGDLALYLQITRGRMRRRDHRIPPDLKPTVVAFCQELPLTDPAVFEQGVAAITAEDTRWLRCDIKCTSLLANILHGQQAVLAGANECILHRADMITEGASSNVFAVLQGEIRTPPVSHWILRGVTRDLTIQTMNHIGVDCRETPFSLVNLRRAEEIWITSSTREILPVTALDGRPVGDGKPGPMWQQVWSAMRSSH